MMKFSYTAERNSGSSMSLYKLTEKSNACKRMALHWSVPTARQSEANVSGEKNRFISSSIDLNKESFRT